MYDFIKSKTLSNYYKNNNIELSDLEQAVIISNNPVFTDSEVDRQLADLMQYIKDDRLKAAITSCETYSTNIEKSFRSVSDKEMFILRYKDVDGFDIIVPGNNFIKLYDIGISKNLNFTIKKYTMFCEEPIGIFTYDVVTGNCFQELDGFDEYYDDYFTNSYFKVNHPFKFGDIVRDIVTNKIGICVDLSNCQINNKIGIFIDLFNCQNNNSDDLDVSDMGIICRWICDFNSPELLNLDDIHNPVNDESQLPWLIEDINDTNMTLENINKIKDLIGDLYN